MHILLFQRDVYGCIGGGETVYKYIIKSYPQAIFYYFIDKEYEQITRPTNVHPIHLNSLHTNEDSLFYWGLALRKNPAKNSGTFIKKIYDFLEAIVAQLQGMEFDIIDIPDFILVCDMIRPLLQKYNVSYKKIVIAAHGRVSSSLKHEWIAQETANIEFYEQRQLETADAIYGISERYLLRLVFNTDTPYYVLDPINIVHISQKKYTKQYEKSNLYYIGRKSRDKGADIFVELIRWINKSLYNKIMICGPDIVVGKESSYDFLRKMIQHRDIDIEVIPSLENSQLSSVFSSNSLIIIPSRYETFNLVALEAIFSGCPVAISDQAGVCDYLDRYYPEIPYIKINMDRIYDCIKKIEFVLEHYDTYRKQLATALKKVTYTVDKNAISQMYEKILSLPDKQNTIAQSAVALPSNEIPVAPQIAMFPDTHFSSLANLLTDWYKMPEHSLAACDKKVQILYDILAQSNILRLSRLRSCSEDTPFPDLPDFFNGSFFSCTLWHELARLQRISGQQQLAAMFELRSMRNLGYDHFHVLPEVCASLRNQGFSEEAEVAEFMFSSEHEQDRNYKIYNFLEKRAKCFMHVTEAPYARVEDARYINEPKVSIVVSLFNAAPKLRQFLTCLEHQTMARQHQVELILQDSCSPTNEWTVIQEFLTSSPLSIFYGRAPSRETVQCAWNRGIKVARAPYLVLLGADEMLYPDGLEKLFDVLDKNSNIDWVVGNAIQTEVDKNGLLVRDILKNDFSNGITDICANDNKYIRWNASMYRKKLHEQFGFYDSSYSNAGCTEFGFRILPEISIYYIDHTLGTYWDYPEIRISNPFINEIAQLRACFVFRTTGGAMYLEKYKDTQEIYNHLRLSLKYRRCVCRHTSTDIPYAASLARLLTLKGVEKHYGTTLNTVFELENILRNSLLLPEKITAKNLYNVTENAFNKSKLIERRLYNIFNNDFKICLYNDFLHERFSFIGLDRSGKENISFIT